MEFTDMLYKEEGPRYSRIVSMREESWVRDGFHTASKFVSEFVSSISESITALASHVQGIRGYMGDNKVFSLIKKTGGMLDDMERFNFMANRGMLLPCPTGFSGDWESYTEMLLGNYPDLITKTFAELTSFGGLISLILSSKEAKTSIRDDRNRIKATEALRTKITKDLTSYIGARSSNQRQTLTQLFPNREAVIRSYRNIMNLADILDNSKKDPETMESEVTMISQKVKSLIALANDGDNSSFSKEVMLNLSEKAFEVAKWVELSANYMAQTETACVLAHTSMERMIKTVR